MRVDENTPNPENYRVFFNFEDVTDFVVWAEEGRPPCECYSEEAPDCGCPPSTAGQVCVEIVKKVQDRVAVHGLNGGIVGYITNVDIMDVDPEAREMRTETKSGLVTIVDMTQYMFAPKDGNVDDDVPWHYVPMTQLQKGMLQSKDDKYNASRN